MAAGTAGDFKLGTTIYIKFCTVTTTGAPTQLAGSPVVSVYENDDNTQITAGVTLNVDEDGVTGLNQLVIVASSGNGYEVGKFYDAVITTGTVGGTSVVGYVVGSFTIEATGLNFTNTSSSAGPLPEMGIADSGTAQSATSTTVVLRSAAAFADNTLAGMTIWVFGSTQGYWQSRQIISNVQSSDTVTVDAFTVTPSGTVTYFVAMTPPAVASGTLPLVNASAATSAVTSAATQQSSAESTTLSSVALRSTSTGLSSAQSAALSSATAQSSAESATLSSVALRSTSAAESATLSTIALVPSSVLSAATSSGGIVADARKINNTAVQGAGTSGNKWRG